jgi:hypothetical protein
VNLSVVRELASAARRPCCRVGWRVCAVMFRNQYDNDITTWSPQARDLPPPRLHSIATWSFALCFSSLLGDTVSLSRPSPCASSLIRLWRRGESTRSNTPWKPSSRSALRRPPALRRPVCAAHAPTPRRPSAAGIVHCRLEEPDARRHRCSQARPVGPVVLPEEDLCH